MPVRARDARRVSGTRRAMSQARGEGGAMVDRELVRRLMGLEVHDRGGSRLGRVSQVSLDDESGQPEFVTVDLGTVRTHEVFVVLAGAHDEGTHLVVPWTAQQVSATPVVAVNGG